MISIREQMLKQGISGLGPPDLVTLKKNVDDLFITTYHHVSGFQINSPSSFPAYFSSIIQKVPTSIIGSPKYHITEGLCSVWNSFANVDIVITVSNPGSCNYYFKSPNGGKYKISELTWRELAICTTLRYWRASDPIYSSLFDLPTIAASNVRILESPPLTPDEIRFAVAAHPPCRELDSAIAHSILALCDRKIIMDLITELIPYAPRVLVQILKYIPQKSPIFPEILTSLKSAYKYASDDIIVASSLISAFISNGMQSKCGFLVPLLINSLWCHPLAGIALSRLSLVEGNPENSLYFLNASCLCREPSWESAIVTLPNVPVIRPKGSPKMILNPIEQFLFLSSLSGPSFHLIRALSEIAKDIGAIKLSTLLRHKKLTAKSIAPKLPKLEVYPQTINTARGSISTFGAAYLFDQGIEQKPVPPKVIEKLPTSQKLLDAAEYVLRSISQSETLKRNPQFLNEVEATKSAIVGLRIGDFQLTEIALKHIQTKTRLTEILKMRLMCETHWTSLSVLFKEAPKKRTLNEENSTIIAKSIAISLESFII